MPTENGCRKFLDELSAAGGLGVGKPSAEFQAHLDGCPACAQALKVAEALKKTPRPEPPAPSPALKNRIIQSLEKEFPQPQASLPGTGNPGITSIIVGGGSLAVVALVVGLWVGSHTDNKHPSLPQNPPTVATPVDQVGSAPKPAETASSAATMTPRPVPDPVKVPVSTLASPAASQGVHLPGTNESPFTK